MCPSASRRQYVQFSWITARRRLNTRLPQVHRTSPVKGPDVVEESIRQTLRWGPFGQSALELKQGTNRRQRQRAALCSKDAATAEGWTYRLDSGALCVRCPTTTDALQIHSVGGFLSTSDFSGMLNLA